MNEHQRTWKGSGCLNQPVQTRTHPTTLSTTLARSPSSQGLNRKISATTVARTGIWIKLGDSLELNRSKVMRFLKNTLQLSPTRRNHELGQAKRSLGETNIRNVTLTGSQNQDWRRSQEYADFLRFKRISSLEIGVIHSVSHADDRPLVHLDIQGTGATMLIDTGALVNVIDEHLYLTLQPKSKILPCKTAFFPYASSTCKSAIVLPIMGQFVSKIRFRGNEISAGFIVIKGQLNRFSVTGLRWI